MGNSVQHFVKRCLHKIWWVGIVSALCGAAYSDPFRPSVQQQIRIGVQVSDEVHRKVKMLPETDARLKLVRSIAAKLLSQIDEEERTKFPWRFTFDIVNEPEVNAFALPGGPIFYYLGLVRKFSTEDQIAAVLAHEITHIRKQHWASAYADNQKRQLGITALLIIFRANRPIVDLASITDELVFSLPYSRRHETEADTVAYDMLLKAGYNPYAMVEVFRILAQATKGRRSEEWISTHPDTANRIKKIEQMMAKSGGPFPPQKPLPPMWFLQNVRKRG